MKIYTVYSNPRAKQPLEDAEFVPEGFSWLMFLPIVNVVVAAYRRCWLLLLVIVAIEAFTYFASQHPAFDAVVFSMGLQWKLHMVLRVTLLTFFGFWVNDFWRAKLEKRGYEFVGIVSAKSSWHSLAEAQQRFYDKLTH